MNKFTAGAIAGATSLMVAVPLFAQLSSAATEIDSSSSSVAVQRMARLPLTQADVQKMIDADSAFLASVDAVVASTKTAVAAEKAALTAAAAITDETARQTAVMKAREDFRAAMEATLTANPDFASAMKLFGGPGRGHGRGPGGMMGMMHGKGEDMLTQKLGMTADELKAALESGKTIEEIAAEKGVTLPARPAFQFRLRGDAAAPVNPAANQ